MAQERLDDEVEQLVEQSEAGAAGDFGAQTQWRTTRAKLESLRNRHDRAIELAREAVEIAAGTDALNLHGDALTRLAEVLRDAGRTDEAESAARDALALFERKGNIVSSQRATTFLADPVR